MKKRGLNLPKQRTMQAPALIWKRVLAFIIDLFVINFIIISPFKKIFSKIFPADSVKNAMEFITQNPNMTNLFFVITVAITVLILIYFTIPQLKIRQTLGMMLMNIYIKSEKKNLTFLQVLVSNLTFTFFLPSFLLWIIDPIFMVFSKKSQRLMQRITKIMVVEEYNME